MRTALSRRSVGCVSDLTIDRWLLGETPGSDEARRVEAHLTGCASCKSRVGALRGLYSTQVPEAAHTRPTVLTQLPARAPGQTGAMQILILRDGLLVGTELFTPGRYLVGDGDEAELQLDGVLPRHASLHFQGGRVAVKAEEGTLYVNGFKVASAELRPVDEVLVGPYVLRSRVVREREAARAPAVSEVTIIEPRASVATGDAAPGETVTTGDAVTNDADRSDGLRPLETRGSAEQGDARPVPPRSRMRTDSGEPEGVGPVLRPAVSEVREESRGDSRTRLTLELWWGGTRQQVLGAEGRVLAAEFPLWGLEVPPDFVLAEPGLNGTFTLRLPGERAVVLEPGACRSLAAGTLTLVGSVGPAQEQVPRAALVNWPLLALTAALLLALFGGMALAPPAEEIPFPVHDMARRIELVPPPKHKAVPPAAAASAPEPSPSRPMHRPTAAPPARPSSRSDPVTAVAQLFNTPGMKRLLQEKVPMGHGGPGGPRKGIVAGLPGFGPSGSGPAIGLSTDGGPRIGATGLARAGGLTGGNFGHGPVGGQVLERPQGKRVGLGAGSTGLIDRDAVAKVILEHLHEISSCYEQGLITNGKAGGRLQVEWTISLTGAVTQAKVQSTTLKDGSIASCVLSHLKSWRFPLAHGSPVLVSYPFVFQSSAF